MSAGLVAAALFVLWAGASPAAAAGPAAPGWKTIARGVESAVLQAPAEVGPGEVHVVRVDPAVAPLRALMASAIDRKARTAGAWCDAHRLVAAINLGMFRDDHLSNVGHARSGAHVNRALWVTKYKSVLVIGPRRAGLPAAAILDLDEAGAKARAAEYDTVVQNLRLIRAPGRNVWAAQPRKWSEAAVAMDRAGRILFVFTRAPRSMHDFGRMLLALPLGVVAAMHVEGGPEASLSLRGAVRLDLNGSFETGFVEDESIVEQWPLPNVLAVPMAAGR